MKTALLIALAIFCSSCGKTVYVTNELPLPDRPVYLTVTAAELECLSQDAYDRLEIHVMQCKSHIETLEDVIKSTHQD